MLVQKQEKELNFRYDLLDVFQITWLRITCNNWKNDMFGLIRLVLSRASQPTWTLFSKFLLRRKYFAGRRRYSFKILLNIIYGDFWLITWSSPSITISIGRFSDADDSNLGNTSIYLRILWKLFSLVIFMRSILISTHVIISIIFTYTLLGRNLFERFIYKYYFITLWWFYLLCYFIFSLSKIHAKYVGFSLELKDCTNILKIRKMNYSFELLY